MSRLKLLYNTTIDMLSTLQELENAGHNREQIIQEMEELISRREALIEKNQPPYTDEEIKIGQKIVRLNEDIKEKMDRLYDDVKRDMKKVKQKKDLNRSYINPYGKIQTTDGMYVDSKN